jgi:thioredoxin-dependent peroxiredoxin
MSIRISLAAIAASAALPALAGIAIGDTAPTFIAPAALDGKPFQFSLQDALKKGPVVVYFYPSAYTNGCNLQAHTFAENHAKFAAAKATVIGVSLDSLDRLVEFSADPEYCAGKVPVASDPKGDIAKSFSLSVRDAVAGRKDTRGKDIDHGFAERTTFVIRQDGKVAATISGVTPFDNAQAALAAAQAL